MLLPPEGEDERVMLDPAHIGLDDVTLALSEGLAYIVIVVEELVTEVPPPQAAGRVGVHDIMQVSVWLPTESELNPDALPAGNVTEPEAVVVDCGGEFVIVYTVVPSICHVLVVVVKAVPVLVVPHIE